MVRLLIIIVLLPALITFIFQKVIFVEHKPWMYRVSFLIGFFVTLYWLDTIVVDAISALRIFGIFMGAFAGGLVATALRSEEHTSELQSQSNLVCRLLLEKKKK